MKQQKKLQTPWFIFISLFAFALVFIIYSIVLNSFVITRTTTMPAQRPADRTGNSNYSVETTEDPFVTRVIKK